MPHHGQLPAGMQITAESTPAFAEILTPEALDSPPGFHARSGHAAGAAPAARRAPGRARCRRHARLSARDRAIRDGDWTVAPIPADMLDRRVEITGPADRKMIINALNSGAKRVHGRLRGRQHADAGTTSIQGQLNLRDAIRRAIDYTIARRQGLPAERQDGGAVRAAARLAPAREARADRRRSRSRAASSTSRCTFSTTPRRCSRAAAGPYFYLPKLESHLEARLWNDIFVMAQDDARHPARHDQGHGADRDDPRRRSRWTRSSTSCATTRPGSTAGRWDYIFSCIKKFRSNRDFCLADRALVTMTTHFMRATRELLVKTCHRRDIHAMGGMAAQIPVKNDEEANAAAFAKVKADKEREATHGHDGTWVAHPGLVPVAQGGVRPADAGAEPDRRQTRRRKCDAPPTCSTFEPERADHRAGVAHSTSTSRIQYIGAWLAGQGAVPIFNLMEDAATAEISRSQVWQWIRRRRARWTTAAR